MKREFQGCLLIFAILLTTLASGDEAIYRVSGVVGQENRWLYAVIEEAGAGCRIYAPGDSLGKGKVVQVSQQGVMVELAGETQFLKLEGSAFINGSAAEEESQASPSGAPRLIDGKLPPQELKNALTAVADELERDKNKKFEPQVLNAILGLPPKAQITSVNGIPVKTPRDSARVLREALEVNHPLRINITGAEDMTSIYLMIHEPTGQQEGEPAP